MNLRSGGWSEKAADTRMAQRLMRMFSGKLIRIPDGGQSIKVTLSVGIAEFPGDTSDMDELMKMADEALYRAKNTGKNKIVDYSKD